MLGKGPAVFASGSKASASITVFNSRNYQELEVANCDSFGATYCFAVLPWDAEDGQQQATAMFAGERPKECSRLGHAAGLHTMQCAHFLLRQQQTQLLVDLWFILHASGR
jgi:uncharacterized membrane protein YjdF